MLKKLKLAIVLTLLIALLSGSTAMATSEMTPAKLPTSGADPMSVAPIGLVIFGLASLGVGLVGYALTRRKST